MQEGQLVGSVSLLVVWGPAHSVTGSRAWATPQYTLAFKSSTLVRHTLQRKTNTLQVPHTMMKFEEDDKYQTTACCGWLRGLLR